jgi:hypothetical protein
VKEIVRLRFVTKRQRPRDWVRSSGPGDLLLFGTRIGKGGGILRIRHEGTFLALDEEQVWRQKPIQWPFANDRIVRAIVIGQQLHYQLR